MTTKTTDMIEIYSLYNKIYKFVHIFFNRASAFIISNTQCAPDVFNLDQKSKAETPLPTYYDAKQVRINQEKAMLTGFPLSYQVIRAGRVALVDKSVNTS